MIQELPFVPQPYRPDEPAPYRLASGREIEDLDPAHVAAALDSFDLHETVGKRSRLDAMACAIEEFRELRRQERYAAQRRQRAAEIADRIRVQYGQQPQG